MTEHDTTHAPASVSAFATARKAWLRARVTELSEALSDFGPQLHALIPADLGDQRLVKALVLCRVAADEARVQPVAETVAWLELLIPHGHRHDLADAVRGLRSTLIEAEDPALWSWHARAWEELVLALWRRDRAGTVGSGRAGDELVSRWGVRTADTAEIAHPERAPHENGMSLTSLADYLADEAEEPHSLLAQAVLSQPSVAEAIENSLAVHEEGLQNAGHLAFLAEQQLCERELAAWCDKQASGGSPATEDFLTELYESAETYADQVLDPVIRALPGCERTLLRTATQPDRRARNEYLSEFLDCVATSSPSAWQDGALDPSVAEEAAAHHVRGELTWHAMRGSVPVWYHIVTSPQERAAALAFSGAASSSAIRVHADVVIARQEALFEGLGLDGPVDEPEDWYPEPGIELRYSRQSATDLCELLALAELGHARLEFLIRGADGGFALLRSLRAEIRHGDAVDWRRGALDGLEQLVPSVDDLADVIAAEELTDQQEGEDEDEDEWGEPDDTCEGSGSDTREAPAPAKSARLPADMLAKVRAILRLAENPAATQAESEAFLQKATAMMAKYGIEQAMLRGDDPTPEQPADRVWEMVAPWMSECKRLLSSIAYAMRCHPVYPGGKANKHRVHLFGFDSDLHSVEVLYASLRLQMLQGAELADARHRPPGELPRAYKRSWMLGFIRAVALRIGEAERAAREDTERDRTEAAATDTPVQGRSVALVLADRTTAVEAKVASRYPKLGKVRRTRFTGSGYRQGHADGQQADIGGSAFADQPDRPELGD
ncbi:DUF2786 domain-containing protein [Streptomyces europaeiscabiei]|uniref:DUF2786 domain-containing protein n=1 Tax=Streptomyces europaeiscabiei TaxID=146819 RepID=A0AAJ2PUY8_9ACTN|nr:DUF2786 domain-containing protein [Streptomyces europaeiscabiei]MDX3134032.1 DUF2786 domain-containing protein [Streptomyces europaeiscabiei]